MNRTPNVKLVERLSKAIRLALAGHPPWIQGAVLGDLVRRLWNCTLADIQRQS